MTETVDQRKEPETDDPEGEWDDVVKRISARIKHQGVGAPTAAGLDLAGELTRLERRALEAEAALLRERDAHSVRVRAMEEKLRKLEPFLRQLKSGSQKAAAERDALREELLRVGKDARDGPAAGAVAAKSSALAAELEAAVREAQTARAARDAAVAEAEALRSRPAPQPADHDAAWLERVGAAEKARDQAVEDLKQMRRAAGENRRTDDEIRRLLKEIEQLEKTTSAHKAVARAAQEEAAGLHARVAEYEKSGDAAGVAVRRSEELAEQLDLTRTELESTRLKLAASESGVAAAHVAEQTLLRELQDKIRALEAAREALEKSKAAESRARADAERLATGPAGPVQAGAPGVAAAGRPDADVRREGERARDAEQALRVLQERHDGLIAAHRAEIDRVRDAALRLVSTKAQEIADGMRAVVAGGPRAPQKGGEMRADATVTAEIALPPAPSRGAGDWDRLISDVEQIWSELDEVHEDTVVVREPATVGIDAADLVAMEKLPALIDVPAPVASDDSCHDGRTTPLSESVAGAGTRRRG